MQEEIDKEAQISPTLNSFTDYIDVEDFGEMTLDKMELSELSIGISEMSLSSLGEEYGELNLYQVTRGKGGILKSGI